MIWLQGLTCFPTIGPLDYTLTATKFHFHFADLNPVAGAQALRLARHYLLAIEQRAVG